MMFYRKLSLIVNIVFIDFLKKSNSVLFFPFLPIPFTKMCNCSRAYDLLIKLSSEKESINENHTLYKFSNNPMDITSLDRSIKIIVKERESAIFNSYSLTY